MNTFIDNNQLCSWTCLTPRCNEYAKKKKSVIITKVGVYIRPLFIQCALYAIKSRYESLKRCRGNNKAIIDIAILLLTSIYHILLTSEVFDYKRFENFNE